MAKNSENPVADKRTATRCLDGSDASVKTAAALLRAGGIVAFPTETVYGLGADATDGAAVARIFAAKNRPAFNPLIVHVADLESAARIGEIPASLLRVAEAFWPGPLTLVVPLRSGSGISPLAVDGGAHVGLRVPAHPLASALIAETDRPLAAPSANRSGGISPTTAAHVLAGLDGAIDAVLDGGPCPVGIESTILAETADQGVIELRPGGLSLAMVRDRTGIEVLATKASGIASPGQLASHYAPSARLRLDRPKPETGVPYLGFGAGTSTYNLSASGDLVEAAARLYDGLHRLDAGNPDVIDVAPIPMEGLGRAINDRLRRAAAPRPSGEPAFG